MPTYEIDVPEGIEIREEKRSIIVKGKKGELSKEFKNPFIKVKVDGKKIVLSSETERKKVKAIMGTWRAILKNMFKGVSREWRGELKMVYSHFPVKIKTDNNRLVIENFLGERNPRSVPIPEGLKAEVKENVITVTGLDRERVGQLCGRIEQITKVRGYDKRVFQDGCYITKKPHVEETGNE
ncbi:MAG: 50S ribosomal protein L6 [Candidatus Aenigmarchaeota archaeon]|nr:50S ribosomal protein L6 [Candidatus Aenigmarchaeota archaeon]